jgi:tRNA(Ile)-lysidine synthase TilS/MesJ
MHPQLMQRGMRQHAPLISRAMSGGKDSIACLLTLIEAGVPASRIDVYHHDVDGAGPSFMDWRPRRPYCRAVTCGVGVPIHLFGKDGRFGGSVAKDAEVRFRGLQL